MARSCSRPTAPTLVGVVGALGLMLVHGPGCGGAASRRPRPQTSAPASERARAIALYDEGRFAEAEALLVRMASEDATNAETWAYLGLARLNLGKLSEAEADLRRSLQLSASVANAHYGLGLLEARRDDLDAAISELEAAVRLDPSHAYAHYHLGLAYNEKGLRDRSILHLRRFLDLAPNAPEAPRVRALLATFR